MVREVIRNGFRTCAAAVVKSSGPWQLHGPFASMNVLSAGIAMVDPRIIYCGVLASEVTDALPRLC